MKKKEKRKYFMLKVKVKSVLISFSSLLSQQTETSVIYLRGCLILMKIISLLVSYLTSWKESFEILIQMILFDTLMI